MNSKQKTLTDIQSAFEHIPADLSHDEWVKCIMSVKSEFGEEGFTVIDEWSKSSSKYSPKAMKSTWNSIRSEGGIGLGTLFHIAKEYGYQVSETDVVSFTSQKQRVKDQVLQGEAEYLVKKQKNQNLAARKSTNRWMVAGQCDSDHPYLVSKKVKAYGIKQGGNGLLVPVRDADDVLWSIQTIYPNGSKRFSTDGRISGCFCPIGEVGDVINICEGWATGAAVNQVTGEFVACAMNAGNLKKVAIELKRKYPEKRIRIIADNDRFTDKNPGVAKAVEAAESVGGEYYIPPFRDDEKGSDFNDYAIAQGMLND